MNVAWSKRYAHGATTATTKTRAEIESALTRFGASKFAYGVDGYRADVMFEHGGRRIKFSLPDPHATLEPYTSWPNDAQLEAENRRLWRSLLMAVKAKLEIVASGISTFETEFLPYTMIDARRTFAEAAHDPEFIAALEARKLPPMLGA